jgi:hypothetical protein
VIGCRQCSQKRIRARQVALRRVVHQMFAVSFIRRPSVTGSAAMAGSGRDQQRLTCLWTWEEAPRFCRSCPRHEHGAETYDTFVDVVKIKTMSLLSRIGFFETGPAGAALGPGWREVQKLALPRSTPRRERQRPHGRLEPGFRCGRRLYNGRLGALFICRLASPLRAFGVFAVCRGAPVPQTKGSTQEPSACARAAESQYEFRQPASPKPCRRWGECRS